MKGKDPRDSHFITSRICSICGDNHATCSVYNQNMAYGVVPPRRHPRRRRHHPEQDCRRGRCSGRGGSNPTIFHGADLAIVTKLDLAEAVEFNLEALRANLSAVRPDLPLLALSAKTGAGMDEWLALLRARGGEPL